MTLSDLYKTAVRLADPDNPIRWRAEFLPIRWRAEFLAQDCRRVYDETMQSGAFPSDFRVVITLRPLRALIE